MKINFKKRVLYLLSAYRTVMKLYYLLGSKFDSEFLSVVSGRHRFFFDLQNGASIPKLRRNIHRLEKGLVMTPRRKVFGLDYLPSVVALLESSYPDSMTRLWGISVLSAYFAETESSDERWLASRDAFRTYCLNGPQPQAVKAPGAKKLIPEDQLNDIARSFEVLVDVRRSVRCFTPLAVSDDTLRHVIEQAISAPSACNRVPYRYYVALNSDRAQEIAKCAGGTAGYVDKIHNIAVIVGDLSNYEYEVDRHAPFIDASLSAMTFIYSLEAQGISSLCINWHDQVERRRKLHELIGLKPWESVVMLVAFGYASENVQVPASVKKNIDSVLNYV